MARNISDLVTDLQNENEHLQHLQKLFNQACKTEFGYDIKGIHRIIEKQRAYELRRAEKQGQQNYPAHRDE